MPALHKYFIESENINLYEQIFENVTIIDAHMHIGVDKDGHSLTASALLSNLKANEINRAIVFPMDDPQAGKAFTKPNDRIYNAYRNSPDILVPFFRLDPNYDWSGELDKRLSQGFRGIKLHPRSQNFGISSPQAIRLYERLEKENLMMLIHTGFGIDSVAQELHKVATAFPKLRILVGHGGFPDLDNVIKLLAPLDNVLFEISTMRIFDLIELLKNVSSKKIVFGSDLPYYDQTLSLQVLIDSANLARKSPV